MQYTNRLWEPCVTHEAEYAIKFIDNFFKNNRNVLFICGAGFDPRAIILSQHISAYIRDIRLNAIIFREERPHPNAALTEKADLNSQGLESLLKNVKFIHLEVLSRDDGAVVGGRKTVEVISKLPFSDYTDIVIDISALSIGVIFPMIRYIFSLLRQRKLMINLHIFVTNSPAIDMNISSIFCEKADYLHGFDAGIQLNSAQEAKKLWMPQLSLPKHSALVRIFSKVKPDETCPIMPWPSDNPKLPDKLLEEYRSELLSDWEVDQRDIVFASESDPLDLYRTILDLDDFRHKVLDGLGGSFLILSPTGSKLMALGSLLAALNRNLPVAYLETMEYTFHEATAQAAITNDPNFYHLWVCGSEAYPTTS